EKLFQCADREPLLVKKRRRQHSARSAAFDGIAKIFEPARAAGGDHSDLHAARNSAQQLEIESRIGAVAIDGCQEDLASSQLFSARAPFDSIESGRLL